MGLWAGFLWLFLSALEKKAFFDAGALVAAGGVRETLNDTMSLERLLIPGALFAVWGAISILIVQKRRADKVIWT